jgi:hypothetical protein
VRLWALEDRSADSAMAEERRREYARGPEIRLSGSEGDWALSTAEWGGPATASGGTAAGGTGVAGGTGLYTAGVGHGNKGSISTRVQSVQEVVMMEEGVWRSGGGKRQGVIGRCDPPFGGYTKHGRGRMVVRGM